MFRCVAFETIMSPGGTLSTQRLTQFKLHKEAHLSVQGLVVQGTAARAALKTETEKWVSISEVVEKLDGCKGTLENLLSTFY